MNRIIASHPTSPPRRDFDLHEEPTPALTSHAHARSASEAVFRNIAGTLRVSFVPDLFADMAARPAYLEAAWELFREDLALDEMDDRTRRIIALALTTDRTGTYCIAAYPHAFRLKALSWTTSEKILSAIRFFRSFDRYLSEHAPGYGKDDSAFRQECRDGKDEAFTATPPATGGEMESSIPNWKDYVVGTLIVGALLFPVAAMVYAIFC